LDTNPSKIIVSLDGHDECSYRAIRGENADYGLAVSNIEALLRLTQLNGYKSQITVRMIIMHINENHVSSFKSSWEEKGAKVEIRDFFPWNNKEFLNLGKVEKYPPFMPCPFPWQYLVVQWNGDVVPCCRDYNGVNILGNVLNESLASIWNGNSAKKFREEMMLGLYSNNICNECMDIYHTEE
jgi:radical SAM protein with 4Fe4S-binding SPASM domain